MSNHTAVETESQLIMEDYKEIQDVEVEDLFRTVPKYIEKYFYSAGRTVFPARG
jgi:hypothetical protein